VPTTSSRATIFRLMSESVDMPGSLVRRPGGVNHGGVQPGRRGRIERQAGAAIVSSSWATVRQPNDRQHGDVPRESTEHEVRHGSSQLAGEP